ncbi:MAG TPA: LPS export ABC transporter periplasmic protein LptC [bacterium]|nr:LPS export ABC transporter periplasmic protein LptC [bacterium]
MKKRTAVVLFTAVIFLFAAGCGEQKIRLKLPAPESVENIPSFVIQGFTLVSTENAVVDWELKARGAQIFEMKKMAYAQDVEMTILEGKNRATKVFSDRAVINLVNNFTELTGNVKVRAENGMVLLTKKLFWDDAGGRIFTEEEVVVIKGKDRLRGKGMESDIHMENVRLKEEVRLDAKDIGNE